MDDAAVQILSNLELVAGERQVRAARPGLADKVLALKTFQHRRFAHTYADLLASPSYGPAARFFLDELYGPADFTQRDGQFERTVPALTRLFSREVVATTATLAELHALSERLDTRMAEALASAHVDPHSYTLAWCKVGRPDLRERQIELTVSVGRSVQRYTRSRLLRAALHAMRRPASLAGLGQLQNFLEVGFDTFKALSDPASFLEEIGRRERELAGQLFAMDHQAIEIVEPVAASRNSK